MTESTPAAASEPSEGAAGQIERLQGDLERVRTELRRVIVGMDAVVDPLLVALLTGGHVLLEGSPGLGKTLLVRTLADTLSLTFRRLQCTPDLMPSDIVGAVLMRPTESGPQFTFEPGPVFTNVLLCDEINRATPKTQAALLESMEERSVTAGGETRALPDPFVVLATQNPIEMEGTYPLPEAQLDRFLFKVLVPRPTVDQLEAIIQLTTRGAAARVETVLAAEDLQRARALVHAVVLAPALVHEIAGLVDRTHPDSPSATDSVKRFVRFGASPRGARAIALAAKARALIEGRSHVSRADVHDAAPAALRHRLILTFEAEAEGVDADAVLGPLLAP